MLWARVGPLLRRYGQKMLVEIDQPTKLRKLPWLSNLALLERRLAVLYGPLYEGRGR